MSGPGSAWQGCFLLEAEQPADNATCGSPCAEVLCYRRTFRVVGLDKSPADGRWSECLIAA